MSEYKVGWSLSLALRERIVLMVRRPSLLFVISNLGLEAGDRVPILLSGNSRPRVHVMDARVGT